MPVDYDLQAFFRFYDKMAIRSEVMGRFQHGKLSDTYMVASPLKHFRLREVMTMLIWKASRNRYHCRHSYSGNRPVYHRLC